MRFIFVDTLYWVASINPQDQWYQRTLEVEATLQLVRLITTETVLIEFLNYFSLFRAEMRQAAAENVEYILDTPNVEVVLHSQETFFAGLALYKARLDKGYSMVDCISMVVMRSQNLTEVLTHDKHFTQEGFQILL